MSTEELEALAREWARVQGAWWATDDKEELRKLAEKRDEIRGKIEALGYRIGVDDWDNVVIVMPFKA